MIALILALVLATSPPVMPSDTTASNLRLALNNSLKYNLNWLGTRTPPYTMEDIRRVGMVSYATGVALKTGAYDESIVGLTPPQAQAIAFDGAAALVNSHKQNGGYWGRVRQSGLWAYYAGAAYWLLSGSTNKLRNMVSDEAAFELTQPIRYWGDKKTGRIITPGNTGAEEDAWRGAILGLAVTLMPNHAYVAKWRVREDRLHIAAFSRKSDLSGAFPWLAGWNIHPDGTLANHNIDPSPQYMASISLNKFGRDNSASRWNTVLVYNRLKTSFYNEDGTVRYPKGNDWGVVQMTPYIQADALMGDMGWLAVHVQRQLDLQARFDDGRTFAPGEHKYIGAEQVVAGDLAMAYLSLM